MAKGKITARGLVPQIESLNKFKGEMNIKIEELNTKFDKVLEVLSRIEKDRDAWKDAHAQAPSSKEPLHNPSSTLNMSLYTSLAMGDTIDLVSRLPKGVSEKVFLYLTQTTLLICRRVSKSW